MVASASLTHHGEEQQREPERGEHQARCASSPARRGAAGRAAVTRTVSMRGTASARRRAEAARRAQAARRRIGGRCVAHALASTAAVADPLGGADRHRPAAAAGHRLCAMPSAEPPSRPPPAAAPAAATGTTRRPASAGAAVCRRTRHHRRRPRRHSLGHDRRAAATADSRRAAGCDGRDGVRRALGGRGGGRGDGCRSAGAASAARGGAARRAARSGCGVGVGHLGNRLRRRRRRRRRFGALAPAGRRLSSSAMLVNWPGVTVFRVRNWSASCLQPLRVVQQRPLGVQHPRLLAQRVGGVHGLLDLAVEHLHAMLRLIEVQAGAAGQQEADAGEGTDHGTDRWRSGSVDAFERAQPGAAGARIGGGLRRAGAQRPRRSAGGSAAPARAARPRGSWRDGAGARPAASPMKRFTMRSSSEWKRHHDQPAAGREQRGWPAPARARSRRVRRSPGCAAPGSCASPDRCRSGPAAARRG